MKMVGNPQGPNVLANELIGGLVSRAAGLPVPQGSPVYLSDEFIDQNPGLWFETPEGTRRPEAGLHFGSLFVGKSDGMYRPTDYISRSRVSSIQNRTAFLGMYVLDVWANHQDSRQAILIANPDGHGSEVCFIDHGHMFAGSHWKFSDRPGLACHPERSVYSNLWQPSLVDGWISHFENVLPDALSQAVSLLPGQWYKGDINHLCDALMNRLANLTKLIEADRVGFNQWTQRGTANGTLRIPHTGIHMLGAAV
ncbi:hypothetical protein [Edaphobacter bradus]|uniref:hypothetical protein n=1 Tax=Edaphobacter bradus TaxID=2259016 RepID=UPI0021E041D1